jgi:hypothetical protein
VRARPYVERQKRPPSAARVPRRGADKPSAHELAVLRKLALPGNYLLVTYHADRPSSYTYGLSGEPVRADRDFALDVVGFARLAQWLVPDPRDSMFDAPAQIWRVRKPEGGNG